ncbi:MAG TPA: hypothetical protein VFS46_02830 [Nitrososphaera sp.]|nr:hypothetical protein [Nitrososphaera sp.]
MEIRKNSVLMLSAPAVAAVLMGAMLVGGMLPNTTDKFSEGLAATGYVTISVVRDGNEIYHYEDHNQITETGIDFIVQQIAGSPSATATAQWIALSDVSTGTTAIDDDDATLTGELDNTNGLGRSQGALAYTSGTDDNNAEFTISETFTATNAGDTNVQRAGLFTASTGGTMVAENSFSSVNLAAGDQLTITWTIDLGVTGLD